MRKLSAVLWCVFGFFAVMLAASCNVGLGESVDTSAPTLEITYPPIGATIRDKFILYGTCSDDKGVTAVTVAVVNTESKQTVDNLRATVNSNGTWQAELNEFDSEGFYKYKDGSYQVSVTAFDDAGHSSGESSRTFDIDNTAPFFVISKPGVVKSENLKASAYGSIFTIEGTIADDHTIALMDVAIYDESGNIVSHEKYNSSDIDFFREEEIATAGGTSVTIAQYAQDLKTVANTRYSNVYGSDSGAGTKNYYASITLTDSAEVYQNPTGSERSALDLESDLVGNVTSNVYLYDDVYTSLMSAKKGLGLSAADLKNIINGTYTGKKDDSDAALSLLDSHVKNTTSNEDNRLYFSLNPQANPNYQVNGFAFSFDASGTVQQASSGNSITVTISAGLDGTNIAPECVKVWCKAYDEQPTDKDAVVGEINSLWKKVSQMELSDEDFSEVSSIEGTGGTAIDGWSLLYDYSKNNDKGSSVSTETFSVVLPEGISMEKYYIIAVTGADVDDVEFLQSEKVYGFAGNEMGVPPTVAITSPDNLAILASSAFEFAGTATINSQSLFVKELKATLTVTDESTSNVVATATDTITCTVDSDNKKIWTTSEQGALRCDTDNSVWKFDPTKLSNYETLKAETEEGKMYLYTLSVTGKSSSGHEANIERSVHIDTKLPSISISSAEPRVTKYEGLKDSSGSDISEKYIYLNGTVTIKGSIDEQNLKEVTYDLLCSTDLSKELTEADSVFKLAESNPNVQAVLEAAGMDKSLGKVFSINQAFDTTKITQLFEAITGKTDPMIKVEVVLMAEDSAIKNLGSENPVGNKVTYYASKDPILNGKTDTTAGKAFVICQETDRPQMTFSNVDPAITSKDDVGIKTVDGKEVNKNLFGTTSDNKIQIPIEDDDSITSVEVTLFDENGTQLDDSKTYYGINPYSINVGKSTYTLNYQLPSTEGKYQIQIDAYDILKTDLTSESSVHKKSSGKFFVAVDSGAPNIKVLTPSEGSYQSGTVSVSGTVSKKEGVTISGKITKGNTEVSGATVNEVTISDSQNSDGLYTWSGTVEMPSDSSDSYKLTYTATDGYGQTTSESRGFVVDITAPTFAITTPSESEVYTADSMYTVKGTISDGSATSGIKGLYWTLTEPTESNGTYSPLSNGNLNSGWNQIAATPTETAGEYTWIANIELPTSSADGTVPNTVYISVVDEAGNVSSVSGNAASSSLKITLDKTAPSTTLLGTGLKKPVADGVATELAADSPLTLDSYYSVSSYALKGVVTEASGKYTVTVDGSAATVDTTNNTWEFTGASEEGTHTHTITVKDEAGNSYEKSVSVVLDKRAPVLTITNAKANALLTENDPSISEDSGSRYYTITGKWKDSLSGTEKLEYRVKYSAEYIAANSLSGDEVWTPWREITDITKSTAESQWSVKVSVREGSEIGIQGRATDAAGNVFTTEEYTGLTIDFSVPSVALSSDVPTYVKKDASVTIEGTCADSYGLKEISVVAKNGGFEKTSGFTFAENILTNKKNGTFTVSLDANTSSDGEWEFEVTAKDLADRTTTHKFSTTVDTVSPTWNDDILVNKLAYVSGENHTWYKNATLPFSGSLTENGSGIKEIRYSITKADGTAGDSDSFTTSVQKDASGNVEKETFSTKLGEFLSKKDESGVAQANTVTLVAEDEAGNISEAKTFDIYIDSEVPTVNSTLTGSQYSNKSLKIDVTGTSSDDSSGVESVKLFITVEGSSDPLVIYKETDDTEIKEITAEPSATGGTLASWSATIPSDFLSELEDKTYAVKATVTDNAGNKATTKLFSIDVDAVEPVIKGVALSDESDKYSVYEKSESGKTVYYAHNAADTDNENVGKKFSITGSVQDAKSGIKSIVVSDGTREIVSKRDGKDITSLPITDIDLSSYTDSDSVELTLTVTDNAGNTKDEKLTVKFDNAAPTLIHAIDTKLKDVFFRIGENDNDDIDENTVDSNNKKLWDNALDIDVGGKYADGTYGNSKTIKIRGTVDDKASGVAMIYYKVISEFDLAGVTEANLQEKLNDKARDFLKKYKTDKTGSFAPGVVDADKTRRVFYTGQLKNAENKNITLGGTDEDSKAYDGYFDKTNGTSGTISGKNYASIYTNFNSVLSGFSTGKNYLIFVIVDNVGNADVDSVTTTVNGTESTFHNISLNVDQTTPYAKSNVDGIKYTNKAENTTLEFTGEASDEDSGLYSITLKQGENEITVKNDAAGGKTTNEFGTLEITKDDGDKKWTWKATVKNDKFFEGAANGDTVSVSLEAKDCAGIGNTKSINAATVIIDTQLDSVTLTAPSDAETDAEEDETTLGTQINGTITLEGTINDTNVLPGTAITRIEYKKASDTAWTEASTTTMPNLALSGSYTFKVEGFDTTKLSDNTEYQLRAVGTDSAGNVKESGAVSIKVSQDSDRPKVNFNNIEWNEKLGKFLLRQGTNSQVTGRISDDDASLGDKVVKKLYITEESYTGAEGETEPTTNYASSSGDFTFEPSITIDGEKTVYIYIEDNGGQTFWTEYTSVPADATTGTNDKLKNPKILVNSAAYANKDDAEIEYISDSNNPTITDANGMPYSKSGNDYKQAATANANLNASFLVGGVNKKYVKLIFSAKDFNGIGGMMAKISDTGTHVVRKSTSSDFTGVPTTGEEKISDYTVDVGANNVRFKQDTTEDSDGYKNAEWTTDYIDLTGWTTGQVTVRLWVYDTIGNAASGTYTFVVDNTPPEIKVTSPANGEEKTGNVSIIGTAYDKGDAGTTNIQWLVPTTTEVADAGNQSATDSLTKEQAKFEYLKNLTTTVKEVSADGEEKNVTVSKWNGGTRSLASESSVSSWQFDFDGKYDEDASHGDISHPDKFIFRGGNPTFEKYDSNTFAENNNSTSDDYHGKTGIYKLPVYFMATDELGNYSIEEVFKILHNPDGDKPKVTITYPTSANYDEITATDGKKSKAAFATLGGTIAVTGSAEIPSGTTSVKKVYLQIADSTGAFDATDKAKAGTGDGNYGFTVVDAYKAIKDATGKEYVSTATDGKTLMTDAIAKDYGFANKAALDAWWGIEVSSTTSWRIQLNASGSMNPTGDDPNSIKIRACGINANGKMGAWTQGDDGVIAINIDKGVPVLSASVVQYASAVENTASLPAVVASQHYSADMFLRGENWYVVLDARDESGISSVEVKNGTNPVGCKESALEKDSNNNKSGKRVYIPIASTNVTAVSYDVVATDIGDTPHSSKATYSFKIDNHAPSIESVKDGTDAPLSESKQNTVSNSNYVYTIQGVSDDLEDGSGVERIVFYYMRKAGVTQTSISNEVVLDPMILPTGSDYSKGKLPISGTGALKAIDLGLGENKPVLYAKEISGNVSEEETGSGTFNKFTASSNFDAHIRAGGLVKIDGIYRKISTVDGNVVTFTPPATAASTGITAQFPIAQVIDANNTAKTDPGNKANPFQFDKGKDDGDEMVESFSKSGSSWTWDASIHSQNMSDGPATLVILAFDKAGNVSGKYFNVMVSNNAPHLAKVYLGTDLNRDGAYSDNEFETYNIGAANGNTDGEETYELTTANFQKYSMKANLEWAKAAGTRTSFTIKNKLAILPEFVGGNGTMKLVFSNDDSRTVTASDGTTSGDMTGKKGSGASLLSASGTFTPTVEMVGVSNVSEEDRNKDEIKNSLTEKSYWELTNLGDDTMTSSAAAATTKSMSFTFWDATDECTQGDNSQYAFLRVKDFIVDQIDDIAPNVVVEPFKWEGAEAEKNNLYYASGSETPLGHIELEADLPTATFSATSGEYDRDPKVSGKIVIRGTAYDETLLGSLKFKMTNFKKAANATSDTEFAMATYQTGANAGWSVENKSIDDDGYQITVEDVSIGQDGHKVNWTVAIDTSVLSDVAHNDAVFTVIATDNGKSNSSANSAGTDTGTTDATKHKPTYQMDVVPYITGMYTALADSAGVEFARSATGRYVVRENESVKLYGFNLKAERNAVKIGSATVTPTAGGTDSDGNYLTLPIGTNSSGAVSITVNSVESLNNANKNPNFTSPTDDSITAVEYNSQADGTANNRLTDDVNLWVWKLGAFDNAMNTTNITSPMMKFDAAGNYYISYGNGSNLFAIEKNGTSTDLETCYNKYHNTNVAFDSDGNFYGVATDTDRVSSEVGGATSFTFFSRILGYSYETVGYERMGEDFLSNAYAHYSRGSNKRRLELSQYGGNDGTYDINRVQRPKLTVSGRGTDAKVYLAYYDSSAKNVKFRYGSVTGTESLTYDRRTGTYTRTSAMSGGIANDLTGNGTESSSAAGYHLIANESTSFKPGAYTAVGYTSTGAAVIAWYDASARRLVYSYNDTPATAVTSTTGNTWQNNAVYLDEAYTGWYVDLTVDDADGVHIAYYNSKSGDLKYAYLENYKTPGEAKKVTVDSYLSVGTNITINVRKEDGKNKPYIYYYNTSSNQTMNSIKVAWRDDMETLRDGAINDKFTGAWESMTVPTDNIPVDATVCGGVPTNGTYRSTVVLGYMTDVFYEKAYIKK